MNERMNEWMNEWNGAKVGQLVSKVMDVYWTAVKKKQTPVNSFSDSSSSRNNSNNSNSNSNSNNLSKNNTSERNAPSLSADRWTNRPDLQLRGSHRRCKRPRMRTRCGVVRSVSMWPFSLLLFYEQQQQQQSNQVRQPPSPPVPRHIIVDRRSVPR